MTEESRVFVFDSATHMHHAIGIRLLRRRDSGVRTESDLAVVTKTEDDEHQGSKELGSVLAEDLSVA